MGLHSWQHNDAQPSQPPTEQSIGQYIGHAFIDWLIESSIRWLVAAILWHSCFGIHASHPELRKGRRSPARDGGQLGGSLLFMYANSQQGF